MSVARLTGCSVYPAASIHADPASGALIPHQAGGDLGRSLQEATFSELRFTHKFPDDAIPSTRPSSNTYPSHNTLIHLRGRCRAWAGISQPIGEYIELKTDIARQ